MHIDDALEAFDGSPLALANALGLTVSAIRKWGGRIPDGRAEHVRLVMKERADQLKQQARKIEKQAKAMEVGK